MCSGGSSDNSAAQAAQNTQQINAQQAMATANLKQQQSIATQQSLQNQQQFDYQKSQDAQNLKDTTDQAARQTTWDASRNTNAAAATNSVNAAFAQFTPSYFKSYQDAYAGSADDEINRQYGLAQKATAFGLARGGNVDSTTAADQAGVLADTQGRAVADQANDAVTASNALQSQTASAKTNLLGQALSSDTLGSPIAGGSTGSVQSAIDASNRAVSGIGVSSNDYAAAIKPVTPALGTLSGIFSGALSGAANTYSGVQDAKLAAAYGSPSAPGATGLTSASVRNY